MAIETLRVQEVAQRLGIEYEDVFGLLGTGFLYGRPDREGVMRISISSVEAYEASSSAPA